MIENTAEPNFELPQFKRMKDEERREVEERADRMKDDPSFPELMAFMEGMGDVVHIQVNEVSKDTVNQVFYAIISTSKNEKARREGKKFPELKT